MNHYLILEIDLIKFQKAKKMIEKRGLKNTFYEFKRPNPIKKSLTL